MGRYKALSAVAFIALFLVSSFSLTANGLTYPSVCRAATGSGQQAFSITLSTLNFEQKLVTAFNTNGCGTAGTMIILTFWYPIPANDGAISSTRVFDNVTGGFYNLIGTSNFNSCRGVNPNLGTCTNIYVSPVFTYTIVMGQNTGHISITFESQHGTFPYAAVVSGTLMFVQNLSDNTNRASCFASQVWTPATSNFAEGFGNGGTGCSVGVPAGGFGYMFTLYTDNPTYSATYSFLNGNTQPEQEYSLQIDTNHCTNNIGIGPICTFAAGWAINGFNAQNGFYFQTACTSACQQVSTLVMAFTFGPACTNASACTPNGGTGTGGPTNTSCNPVCNTKCTGTTCTPSCTTATCISNNGNDVSAGNYTASDNLYYYIGQNTASGGGTVYNFTTKIAQAHCTKSTCYLYQAIYVPSTPTSPPGNSNQLTLYSPVTIFPITNGSSNVGLTSQMSIPIPAGYYWADVVASNSTASRTTGASGSGVSIYAATWNSTMYGYQAASLMPLKFIGNIYTNYPLYFRASLVTGQAPVYITTTTTTTLSVSTTLTTSTISLVVNAPNQNEGGGGFIIPMMFVMLPFALFGMIGMILKRFGSR